MGSATRTALESAKAALASVTATASAGEQLLAAGRALDGSAQLRSVLSDPGVPASEKAALVGKVFAQLEPTATQLLNGLVASRWSSPDELVDGVEEIGIRVIARAAGAEAGLESEFFAFERAVSGSHELELALGGKLGDPAEKAAIVGKLLSGKASASTIAILQHLVQSPRGRRIGGLIRTGAEIVADAGGAVVATVTAPTALGPAQLERLASLLAAQYGRPPRIRLLIDPEIVGGLRVQVGNDVVDGTISSRLAELRQRIAG